jgi:glycosyltransferase involved in cell wall biosynthesis
MSHVWIINQASIAPRDNGSTRHYSLARQLIAQGFEVSIIAQGSDYHTGAARVKQDTLETIDGITYLWLRPSAEGKGSLQRLLGMFDFASRIYRSAPLKYLPSPDIILGSSPQIFGAYAAMKFARRHKIPFILEIRDLWPDSLIELGGFSPLHPLILFMRWLEHALYNGADCIITLLAHSRDYLIRHGAHPDHITVIPNFVDASLLKTLPTSAPNTNFTVLYAGAHGVANQLDTLLNAAAILQNEPIDFIFAGDGIHKSALMEKAAALQLKHVTFEPPVPKTAMATLLGRADAFYLQFADLALYRYGVSPNKLYDYLLAAKPILYAANVGANPVSDVDAGIMLPPGDAVKLADAIRSLASMPADARVAMGARGRQHVLEQYEAKIMGTKLATLISGILSQHA